MAIKFKDYYEVLGVPRTAAQEDVKQAYRKLARKYHPDVSGGQAGAEDKFKEINEAYEVLKDPEKRRKYDSLGSGVDREGGFRPPEGWEQAAGWRSTGEMPDDFGFNVGGTGFSDFFEAFFGARRTTGDPFAPGGTAGGFGRAGSRRGGNLEADIMVTLDEVIRGSTRQLSVQRGGEPGRAGRVETYQVRIPPGVRQGQRIRLAGKGEAGMGGAPPGDLYLRVVLSEDPDFRVAGSDLFYDLPVAPWEAVLGARIQVPTPSGNVSLKIPPGTVAGQKFRLRQQGLPREGGVRGDMYAIVQVQVPASLSPDERALWEDLARRSRFKPRGDGAS